MTPRDEPRGAARARLRRLSISQQEPARQLVALPAALVFPIRWNDMQTLAAIVLKPQPITHAV